MYGPPRCCKGNSLLTKTVCTNVSGLLQARRGYAQAKMNIRTLCSHITGSVLETVFALRVYRVSILLFGHLLDCHRKLVEGMIGSYKAGTALLQYVCYGRVRSAHAIRASLFASAIISLFL